MNNPQHDHSKGDEVPVVYVEKRFAKQIKTFLEKNKRINKDFRMVPGQGEWNGRIAIPIKESLDLDGNTEGILGKGTVFCPFSTSLLGNHVGRTAKVSNRDKGVSLSLVEQALLKSLEGCQYVNHSDDRSLLLQIRNLTPRSCPRNLEYLGDDSTLVLPRRAFSLEDETFVSFLAQCGLHDKSQQDHFASAFWEALTMIHKSPRLVRRGEIAPSSGIRESNYQLLWPFQGVPEHTGPGSPGWITVTEQQIRQSFDMTRVMFSRGNISEKIRFGKLVQKGDVVLDLYGGIGYFTLPALVHGEAEYVYACEWNPEAAKALRFNLLDNGVADRATVLEGDCRELAQTHRLVNMFDRVSLGLLPSSEGGWWTAVQALRLSTGGWLHVHGNVPVVEKEIWTTWLCRRLWEMTRRLQLPSNNTWSVVCTHVEKVKSFAPRINHYVADVFVGDPETNGLDGALSPDTVAIVDLKGRVSILDLSLPLCVPSCALSKDGILHQEWML